MVIEAEIKKQTENLFHALESKKILLKELHHRIKNNLQLILSIVRMQTGSVESSLKNQFVDLANRIIAISKTHEMLYLKENLQAIDMNEYIAIQEQTCEYQRLEKDVIARRKLAGTTSSFKNFQHSQVHFFLIVQRISHK